jgi:PST family polysaccharide transporter
VAESDHRWWRRAFHLVRLAPPQALLAVGSGTTPLIGLVQGKVVAVLLGPEGVGLLGQISGLFTLGTLPISQGPALYLVRAIAAGPNERTRHPPAQIISLTVMLGIVAGVGMALFSAPVAAWALGDADLWWAVCATALALLLSIVVAVGRSLLQGAERIGTIALIDVGQSLAAFIGIATVVALYGPIGALANWPIGILLTAVLVAVLLSRHRIGDAWFRLERPRAATIRAVGIFSAASLVGALGNQLPFVMVRSEIIHSFGEREAGLYHAALSMSFQVVSVVLFSQASYIFPRLSALAHDPPQLFAEVDRFMLNMLGIYTPLALVLSFNAPLVVDLLLAPSFAESVPLMRWQLLVETARLVPWALIMAPLPLEQTGLFAVSITVWAIAFVGLTSIGLPWIGLAAPYAATAVAHCLMFGLLFGHFRRRYGYVLDPRVPRAAIVSLGAMLVSVGAAQFEPDAILALIATPFAIAAYAILMGPDVPPLVYRGRVRALLHRMRRS